MARIWKGGCIIRARFLDSIMRAFERQPGLPNLLLDAEFMSWLQRLEGAWRKLIATAVQMGIPVPAMSASLSYFDSYRSAAVAAKPDPGAARSLRSAHLSACRPARRGIRPYRLAQPATQGVKARRSEINGNTRPTETANACKAFAAPGGLVSAGHLRRNRRPHASQADPGALRSGMCWLHES